MTRPSPNRDGLFNLFYSLPQAHLQLATADAKAIIAKELAIFVQLTNI